jgi:FAD/FMN-containing dehydrogenase
MERTLDATALAGARWEQLAAHIQGRVIVPGHPDYDDARKAWNLVVDQHPALIVIAANAADVQAAVVFGGQEDLGIAVQSGGHGIVQPADGRLLIVTNGMKEIRVNPAAQTAWIAAGAKWGEVLARTQPAGLAPLLGSSPDVGVVGYTLGGGFGWLGRKYGLATDSVHYFELVTADGRLLRASETENSDLFWGLRGGGGGLGIITGMEIQLYPVTTVYGGNLFYPIEAAREVFRRYRDWIVTAPDELTSSVAITNFPPLPMGPEFLRGKSVVMVRGCYCGPIDQGEALLQSWRDWRAPMIDDWKRMPFSDVATISNDPVDPLPGLATGAWLRELSDEAIDILVETGAVGDDPPPLIFAEVRHAGGRIAGVHPGSNAYSHRDAPLLLEMVGVTPTPEAHAFLGQYTGQLKARLAPYLTGGVYMNFLEGAESRQRVRDGFSPQSYRRLAQLKAAYDPDHRLHAGFDIPPGA